MPKIRVNDIQMYYETFGQGEPLILVAGFSADHLTWLDIVGPLEKKYRLILIDNRGAGQTDIPDGPYSIEQMAKDIRDLCVKLNIDKAHIIGNSMGGYIVQSLAYQYPELVKSLVISNSTMGGTTCFHYYLAAQYEFLKANAPIDAIIEGSCSWVYSCNFLSKPGKLAWIKQAITENPYPFTLPGYQAQLAALKNFNSRTWVKQIKAPTLVLSGSQDLIFYPALAKGLVQEIPGAKYYCFENCGHLPHIEYPTEYANLIDKFIQNKSI